MAEVLTDEQPWLTLTEAAAQTGLDREAIRAQARRGLIPHRQGNRGQWLVQLPADHSAIPDAASLDPMAAPDAARAAATADLLADLQAEIAEARIALARAEAARDAAKATAVAEMAATVAEARAEAADARAENRVLRETLDRERARVDHLEAELSELRRPWWRRMRGR